MFETKQENSVGLLRLMVNRTTHSKYRSLIKEYVLDSESNGILLDFGAYFDAFTTHDEIDWPTFYAWTRSTRRATLDPTARSLYESAVAKVEKLPLPDEKLAARFIELDYAGQIGGIVDNVLEGRPGASLDKIANLLTEYQLANPDTSTVVPSDLAGLVSSVVKGGGVEWRLEDLNKAVGPLRQGDFVLIGKRPEVGGTSFVASEITHMASQLPAGKDVVFFNNEEVGRKVAVRLYESALGKNIIDLASDTSKSEAAYQAVLKGHKIDVVHKVGMDIGFVESVLKRGNYGIIVFNMLAKIAGFNKLEGVARLGALGGWARSIADKYGVVFAVHQADNSAEGVEYLDQSQLYGTKTELQGESDVQLMIGKSHNPALADKRYISVVRNKLPGGPRTDPTMKYARFECDFDWETGRFESISFRGKA